MKKIIAAVLALILCLSLLSACKSDELSSSGAKLPEIKITEEIKDFKNADGKVAYQVEYSLPELTTDVCSEYASTFINNYIKEFYLDPVFAFAEANVQNFRAEETEPRKISVSHEIKYRSENVISVVFKTAYSKASSVTEARTFNLKDGSVISFDELLRGTSDTAKEDVILCIKDDAKNNFTDAPLTDEQLAKIDTAFDPVNFYFTNYGIYFMFNYGSVLEGFGASSGIYEYCLEWAWANSLGLVASPEDMVNETTTA